MLALAATHVFWIASRAAGIVALLAASLSVAVGLTMGGRLLARRQGELRILHEALSLAALGALALHALSLLGDGWVHLSLGDVLLPFSTSLRAPWMGIGIVAGWMTALLGLSYYARGRIGVQRWRRLHRFTALAWLLALVHALGAGTDAGAAWFLAAVGIVAVPALALLVVRLSDERVAGRPSATPAAASRRTPAPAEPVRPRLWSRA